MKAILAIFGLLFCTESLAVPLSTIGTFCSTFPDQCRKGTIVELAARGIGTNVEYMMEVDPTTGAIPVSVSGTFVITGTVTVNSRTYADSARISYGSTSVTTGAWVQYIASTAAPINMITIFDSCGQTLELGTGAPASETRIMIIPPGGIDGQMFQTIPQGTRVALRAISGTCSVGEDDLTGYQ